MTNSLRPIPRAWIVSELSKLGKSKLLLHSERPNAIKERNPIGPGVTLADLHHAYTKTELRNHVRDHNIYHREYPIHSSTKEALIELLYDYYNNPTDSVLINNGVSHSPHHVTHSHDNIPHTLVSDFYDDEDEDLLDDLEVPSTPYTDNSIVINNPVNCKFIFRK